MPITEESEITFIGTTPEDRMYATGMRRAERHEVLPDGEWIKWVQRQTGMSELFVYYHRETENFVLAAWLRYPDIFKEMTTFPYPPDWSGWGRPTLSEIREQLQGSAHVAQLIEDRLSAHQAEERRKMGEDHTRALSKARHFRKTGHDEVANMIECRPDRYMGPEVGGQRHEHMTEIMTDLAMDKEQVLIDKKLETDDA